MFSKPREVASSKPRRQVYCIIKNISSERKSSKKDSNIAEMHARIPLGTVSNPSRQLIGEGCPHLCTPLAFPNKISL